MPGCKKDKEERELKYREVNVRLHVDAADGTDLCDPDSPGAFTTENTDLFYLIGHQYEKVQTSNANMPENLMFFQNNTRYQLVIIPSTTVNDQQLSTTLLKFGHHVPDTIRVRYKVVEYDGFADSVWVNGVAAKVGEQTFQLVK